MRSRLLTVIVALLGLAAAAPAAQAGPFATLWGISPGVDPPGVNADCTPSAAHPNPVVLVHGTWMDRTISWNLIGEKLVADGYCVFSLDYGRRGTQPVADSAAELATFVDGVLQRTGATKVAIVGHSQGGMMPRYYLKFDAGIDKVSELIGLAPSNHGSADNSGFGGYAAKYGDSPAAADQLAGSPFMQKLNGDGIDAPQPSSGEIDYTVISTRNDEIVMPYQSQALAGPSSVVTNVVVQDKCPADQVEHIALPYDPVALQWVENALGRAGPADPAFAPTC
jgi:triacylglycerol esterase/lipase EstA (alpha/beta hydrolase family)